jgi:hypothetical protein
MSELQTVEERSYYLGKRRVGSGMAPERYFKRVEGDTLRSRLLADNITHMSMLRRWWIKRGHPLFIGKIWAKEHTGYIDYFLFWCDRCEDFQVDYTHGHYESLYCRHRDKASK